MATGRTVWNTPADYDSWVYKTDTKEAFGNKYPVFLNKAQWQKHVPYDII